MNQDQHLRTWIPYSDRENKFLKNFGFKCIKDCENLFAIVNYILIVGFMFFNESYLKT